MRKGMSCSESGKLGALKSKVIQETKLQDRKENYYMIPKLCEYCGNIIKYKKRHNRFCNRSCSASFNNKGVRRHGNSDNNKKEKVCLWCGGSDFSKNSKKFCSMECHHKYEYYIFINKWKLGIDNGNRKNCIANQIRRYLFDKYNNKCSRCGWKEINPITNKVPLEIEHIDGNHKNNNEYNLDLICPNCHSLTPTYKLLNKGNGRYYRKKRYNSGKSY